MTNIVLLSYVHYMSFAFGLLALVLRQMQLKQLSQSQNHLRALFYADTLWGLAAIAVIATGLYKAFGGLERPVAFYIQTPFFHIKMTLVLLILLLELWPMLSLLVWRFQVKAGKPLVISAGKVKAFKIINMAVLHLYVIIPLTAVAMARGLKF